MMLLHQIIIESYSSIISPMPSNFKQIMNASCIITVEVNCYSALKGANFQSLITLD